jgi:vanillate O-demethylase ferredoxin subunit
MIAEGDEGKYPTDSLRLKMHQITNQAELINSFEMVDASGKDLPIYSAGAHIDFYFHDGRIRQYSLCGDPSDRKRYLIAVLRDLRGTGGSIDLHERLHTQRDVFVGRPRNNFPVHKEAKHHLMIAGGIGVTPMLSMIYEIQKTDDNFTLHYCTKSIDHTAFQPELADLVEKGRVVFHHDQGIPGNGLDIETLLKDYKTGTHLYYCGPPGFMGAVEKFSSHWPEDTVHYEYFGAPTKPVETKVDVNDASDGFQVKIASTSATYTVPENKTIIEVLAENGIKVDMSCNTGLCKTCALKYLEGDVDHRDVVLSKKEQAEYITPCVSRAKSGVLVLDL